MYHRYSTLPLDQIGSLIDDVILDKFVPLQKVRSKARPSAPWFDADCRRLKTKTRKLEKSYRKKPSNESRLAWLVGAVRRPTRAVPEQTSTLLGVCYRRLSWQLQGTVVKAAELDATTRSHFQLSDR